MTGPHRDAQTMASTAQISSSTSDTDFKRTLLNSILLFRGVEPDEIADLLAACGRIDIEKGHVLLSPKIENRCVYVLLSGELGVHIGSLQSKRFATLTPGACTGEMSIIDNKDPSAFVVATEDCHLMVISHQLLWNMVERSHTFAKNLLIVLSERVRSDNAFIASSLDVLRRAQHTATTDALTGLGNRHWFNNQFKREVRRLIRSGESACLLMIDIDDFKAFNDRLGHIAGDNVIVAVAQTLIQKLRTRDLVARFGGDEFAVLLPGVDAEQGAEAAERIRAAMHDLAEESLGESVTVSVGVAVLTAGDTLAALLGRADQAMYDAKAAGRDRIVVA